MAIPPWPKAMRQLTQEFDRFPGIGEQGARRMTEWLIYHHNPADLAQALEAVQETNLCEQCNLIYEGDECAFCPDSPEYLKQLAVVEHLAAAEQLLEAGYQGALFVLHGLLSPARNIAPDKLKIPNLVERIKEVQPDYVWVATVGSVEGQVTADYVTRKLAKEPRVSVQPISLNEFIEQIDG